MPERFSSSLEVTLDQKLKLKFGSTDTFLSSPLTLVMQGRAILKHGTEGPDQCTNSLNGSGYKVGRPLMICRAECRGLMYASMVYSTYCFKASRC